MPMEAPVMMEFLFKRFSFFLVYLEIKISEILSKAKAVVGLSLSLLNCKKIHSRGACKRNYRIRKNRSQYGAKVI